MRGISMKKALFWDFDGTLIHPNESFLDAMHTALSKHNFMVSPDEIRAFLRTACSWYTPEAAYTDKTGEQWWTALYDRFSLFYKKLGVPQAKEMIINNHFRQQILDSGNYALYDDAVPVLKRCIDMGYKNYILSNNYPELSSVAKELGLSTYISGYFVSSLIGYEKPRIELFRHALHVAGSPDYSCMIGDNPVADIQGGKAAGMNTILVHQNGDGSAGCQCHTLSEIPSLLL